MDSQEVPQEFPQQPPAELQPVAPPLIQMEQPQAPPPDHALETGNIEQFEPNEMAQPMAMDTDPVPTEPIADNMENVENVPNDAVPLQTYEEPQQEQPMIPDPNPIPMHEPQDMQPLESSVMDTMQSVMEPQEAPPQEEVNQLAQEMNNEAVIPPSEAMDVPSFEPEEKQEPTYEAPQITEAPVVSSEAFESAPISSEVQCTEPQINNEAAQEPLEEQQERFPLSNFQQNDVQNVNEMQHDPSQEMMKQEQPQEVLQQQEPQGMMEQEQPQEVMQQQQPQEIMQQEQPQGIMHQEQPQEIMMKQDQSQEVMQPLQPQEIMHQEQPQENMMMMIMEDTHAMQQVMEQEQAKEEEDTVMTANTEGIKEQLPEPMDTDDAEMYTQQETSHSNAGNMNEDNTNNVEHKAKQENLVPELVLCKNLLTEFMKRPETEPFNEPVNWKGLNLPDYPLIITKPMDLGTVATKLECDKYSTADQFASDVRLVFKNAKEYNCEGSGIYLVADSLLKQFERRYARITKNLSNKKRKSMDKMKNGEASTFKERETFTQLVQQLQPQELGAVVEILDKKCPMALNDAPTSDGLDDELEIEVYHIDGTTLRDLIVHMEKTITKRTKKRKQGYY